MAHDDRPPAGGGLRRAAGRLLHHVWLEALVVLLVAIEIIMTLIELGVHEGFLCFYGGPPGDPAPHGGQFCESPNGPRTQALLHEFERIAKTILNVFAVELALKIFVGQAEFLRSVWHLLDVSAVAVNFVVLYYIEEFVEEAHHGGAHRTGSHGGAHGSMEGVGHLVMFVRLWRMVKFFKLVDEEKELIHLQLKENQEERVQDKALDLCKSLGLNVNGNGNARRRRPAIEAPPEAAGSSGFCCCTQR